MVTSCVFVKQNGAVIAVSAVLLALPSALIWVFFVMPPNISAAFVTGACALIGVAVGKYLERRQDDIEKHRIRQLPIYQDFLQFLFQMFKNEKQNGELWTEQELADCLMDFGRQLVILGSDHVITEYVKFRTIFLKKDRSGGPNTIEGMRALANLFLAIRSDLGHKNEGLGLDEILIMFVNDPEPLLAKAHQ